MARTVRRRRWAGYLPALAVLPAICMGLGVPAASRAPVAPIGAALLRAAHGAECPEHRAGAGSDRREAPRAGTGPQTQGYQGGWATGGVPERWLVGLAMWRPAGRAVPRPYRDVRGGGVRGRAPPPGCGSPTS